MDSLRRPGVLDLQALRFAGQRSVSLGRSFSANVAIRAEQRLKSDGLFRYVRHPSYFGLLLVIVAVGLHTHNWIGFAIVVIPPFAA